MLLWLTGVAMFCEAIVGNMAGTPKGGGGYGRFGTSGGNIGIAGMAGMAGMGKKPLDGGWMLIGCGCMW